MQDTRCYVARAPVRVDPAGGGTDAPPFSVEHGGLVLNMGIARHVYARLEVRPGSRAVEIVSEDLGQEARAESLDGLRIDGTLDLLKGIALRMRPAWGFHMSVCSDVMPGSGLGSSGAAGVACVGAFDAALGVRRSQGETADLANSVERDDLKAAGGNQDSYGAAFGGINAITYLKGGGTERRPVDVAARTVYELERRCVLVYTGEVHLSGNIHSDIKRRYALPNSPTVDAMQQLVRVARESVAALERGDTDRFGELLSENWTQHRRLHESCDSARLRRFYEAARDHAVGGKTCGAGGGGCVLFLAREGRRKALERACVALGGELLPFGIDPAGLVSWEA
ncbi:MAG: hypothetical protein JW951_06845 [Lentisphaerae bacterium]|nr:hypothetical protein [Lentisphaerota bacterium]